MTLIEKINKDLSLAMKAKDSVKLRTLRAVKSMISLEDSKKNKTTEINDEIVLKLISKAIKQRNDSATIYKNADRTELYSQEIAEIEVLESYMPKQLTDDELTKTIEEIVTNCNATSMKDMGKVMKIVTKELVGIADSKRISNTVKSILC